MTSVRQAKHQHNVQKWTQIIMEQRASGLSGLAYCRRAGINSKTFYYWQNVIQKELLASKAQYADVVETLSPSSEPLKPSKVEHETSAPKTPATSVEVAHETVEPPAESIPALPELPESTSQEEVHFVSLKCIRPSSQPAQSPQPALERFELCILHISGVSSHLSHSSCTFRVFRVSPLSHGKGGERIYQII